MSNPYKIEGPALLSISGGRTSGFMLRQIMDAHGGTLPGDVIPVFCNTGREHEATLAFLHEIERRWCPLVWLEYRYREVIEGAPLAPVLPGEASPEEHVHSFEVVDYCRASRNGEPFTQLLSAKSMLPNPVTRFCTSELKIRTGNRYAKRSLGWSDFDRAVGLRADEPRRVHRLKGEGGEHVVVPMYQAGHALNNVMEFWSSQDFDLRLPGDNKAFGNCDLCFLKARAQIENVMRTEPSRADWWIAQEERDDLYADGSGRWFRRDRPTYRQMLTQLTVQGRMYDDAIEDDTLPCACTD